MEITINDRKFAPSYMGFYRKNLVGYMGKQFTDFELL